MDRPKFPIGNELWKLRVNPGKPRKFTPETLLEESANYFSWSEKNPLYEQTLVTFQGTYKRVNMPKIRPFTLKSLCLFLGIAFKTWCEYRKLPEYSDVCEYVESQIYEQKFAGASAGFFNPVIIARDLGLKEKTELTGEDGKAVEYTVNVVKSANSKRDKSVYDEILKADKSKK